MAEQVAVADQGMDHLAQVVAVNLMLDQLAPEPVEVADQGLEHLAQVVAVSHRPEFQKLADHTVRLAKSADHTVVRL